MQVLGQLLAQLRTVAARHAWARWLVVAACAATAGGAAWRAARDVDAARASWGSTRTVWVARADVHPGDPLVTGDGTSAVEQRTYPAAVVPEDALDAGDGLAGLDGLVAVQRVGRGEVVSELDVGTGAAAGPLALVPDGWRAVAIPTEVARPPLRAGDHVAVYASGDELAGDALVVAVDDTSATVAVPARDAGTVSAAARDQLAVLALRRPGGR